MRPRKLRRILLCVAAGAVLAGTGTGYVARADVSDDAFFATLDQMHVPYGTRTEATKLGHQVCDKIGAGNATWQITTDLTRSTRMTIIDSAVFVGTSIGAYCPIFADKIGATTRRAGLA